MSTRGRVFVGLSGGVDSSVAAAMLTQEGYEVIGVFLRVWQADFLPCTWREERRSAMRAATAIGIPFVTLDRGEEYKAHVVDAMVAAYARGEVPNPDVLCNKQIKFGTFFDYARAHGADLIATGHYARLSRTKEGDPELLRGVDPEKDQAYFLAGVSREALRHVVLPIGGMKKSEVRALARDLDLPTAEKKDSQGLCFLGHVDMPDFLGHFLDLAPGIVLDQDGSEIGTHRGAAAYALGQRHGFHLAHGNGAPYYVVAKDLAKNTIRVSPIKPDERKTARIVSVQNANWLADLNERTRGEAEYRYHGGARPAELEKTGPATFRVEFDEPVEDLSSGQILVFSRGEQIVAAGEIAAAA